MAMPMCWFPDLVHVNLFGKKVFADGVKNLEMRSSRLSRWNLNPMTSVLMRDRRIYLDTQRR